MWGLFGGEKKTRIIVILELGTGAVVASIARLNREGVPELLLTERTELQLREVRSGKAIAADLLKASTETLRALKPRAALYTERNRVTPLHIEDVVVLLGAPWARPSLRTLRLTRSAPFVVREDTISRMLEGENKGRSEEKEAQKGFTLIERTAVALRLNGYAAPRLIPTPVLSCEVALWSAFADAALITTLRERLEDVLPHAAVTMHSFGLASFFGITRAIPEAKSYIHIDVTAEMSEGLLVREGVPVAIGSFPQGKNLLLRTLKAQGLPEHEALSAIALAREGTSRMRDKVGAALRATAEDWRKDLRDLLLQLSGAAPLPKTVILAAPDGLSPWFEDALKGEPLLQSIGPGKAEIIVLTPRALREAVALRAEGAASPSLLATIFADARFDRSEGFEILSTRKVAVPLG